MQKTAEEIVVSNELTPKEIERYSRHLVIPEVGIEGQQKLKSARVLLIGAGGLGSPAAMYLAAAGVGKIGIVDFDTVSYSNLQRQVIYSTNDVGHPKTGLAKQRLHEINPNIEIETFDTKLTKDNALEIAQISEETDGTLHSRVLPGLWFRAEWFWQEPLPAELDVFRAWKLLEE
jgi:adenylyltransferase/sulfurtransferase